MNAIARLTYVCFAISGAALTVIALAPTTSRPTTVNLTSVEVLTDQLVPIEGSVVQLNTSSTEIVSVTSVDGQTPWLNLNVSTGVRVVLVERVLPTGGISIGMIEAVQPFYPVDPTVDVCYASISRTQPIAVPLLIQGLRMGVNNLLPPDGTWPHWIVAVPEASSLRFSTNIAPLLDGEAIRHYFAYRGHAPDSSLAYVRGVVMVVPTVKCGVGGFVVGIRLLGDLQSGSVLDAYNFTSGTPAPVQDVPLSAALIHTQNDVAYVQITGTVQAGQLALLVRPPSGVAGHVVIKADNPPHVVVPADGGQGTDSARALPARPSSDAQPTRGSAAAAESSLFVTDCDPPTPGTPPGWSCNPAAPASTCGAPASGPPQCQTVRSRTAVMCRAAGSTVRAQQAKTVKWKVSFELTGAGGTPLSTGGAFEYGSESTTATTDEWTAAAGASGLGQCMRFFRFELVCAQVFAFFVDKVVFIEHGAIATLPCAKEAHSKAACRDTIISQGICDRTP